MKILTLLYITTASQRRAALTASNLDSVFSVNSRSSSSCQLTVTGTLDGLDIVQSASVRCSEADNLRLKVVPTVEELFTGGQMAIVLHKKNVSTCCLLQLSTSSVAASISPRRSTSCKLSASASALP